MKTFNRRSFIEKAGSGLALGSVPLSANAKGSVPSDKKLPVAKTLSGHGPVRNGIERCVAEWEFASGKVYADPFNDVELDVVFTDTQGNDQRVPAFWAGEQTWRVRYSAPAPGIYTYRTISSDPSNSDLHGQSGIFEVSAYQGENSLRKHGALKISKDLRHFEHEDGTPFFWLGDTWWMGFCSRLKWPEDFQFLVADRLAKRFTVVQIIAGLYPDMPAFDPRGANEAGFPWEQDYRRINPRYFDMADLRIQYLSEHGLVPCIVACWGYFLPIMGVERLRKHWRNLIARWGAYSVVWCLAGEGAMPYYLSKTKTEDAAAQKKGWTEIGQFVRKTDPYHRLITIHPTDNSRNQLEDVSVLDFEMLQTGHSDRRAIPRTVDSVVASLAKTPRMPVIVAEVCYEGIMEASRQEVQRFMFWTCMLNGVAGHTYGANGIWQINTAEKPFGPSPHGHSWGDTPWDVAARLPGSGQIGLGKELLMRYPWWRFEPHPDWVEPHWNKDDYHLPFAAGIPEEVRFIFVPQFTFEAPKIKGIESRINYQATLVEPFFGKRIELGKITPDSSGTWQPTVLPSFADWVIVLEKVS